MSGTRRAVLDGYLVSRPSYAADLAAGIVRSHVATPPPRSPAALWLLRGSRRVEMAGTPYEVSDGTRYVIVRHLDTGRYGAVQLQELHVHLEGGSR